MILICRDVQLTGLFAPPLPSDADRRQQDVGAQRRVQEGGPLEQQEERTHLGAQLHTPERASWRRRQVCARPTCRCAADVITTRDLNEGVIEAAITCVCEGAPHFCSPPSSLQAEVSGRGMQSVVVQCSKSREVPQTRPHDRRLLQP